MRFTICRREFNLNGSTCDNALTDSVCLIAPGEDAAAALNPIIHGVSPLIDQTSKGIVLGGMRFYCEWAINSDTMPAEFANLVTLMNMSAFIFKAHLGNATPIGPAAIPSPWHHTIGMGDRGQHQNILWQKMWHVPLGFNDTTTVTCLASSDGAWALRGGLADQWQWGYWGDSAGPQLNLVKTKRRLDEFDGLFLGVSGVHGVTTVNTVPVVFNLLGQVAFKRTRRTSL